MFQAAVFMRSPDSLESRPPKAREMRMTKGVEVLTASWVTGGEATDRGGAESPQCRQTLKGHMATNECCRLLMGFEPFLTMTMTH